MLARHALFGLLAAALSLWAAPLLAYSSGISGYSGRQGVICTACHSGGNVPMVTLDGPAALATGATGTYTFTVQSAAPFRQIAAGFDVAASAGTLILETGQGEQLMGSELTHTRPKANDSSGQATWKFKWKAPAAAAIYTIWAAGNSVNLNTTSGGDNAAGTTLWVAVGGAATVTPTVTPAADTASPTAPMATPTETPVPSATASAAPTPTATSEPTVTGTETATPTSTASPSPPATASPTPTATPATTPAVAGDGNCDGALSAADVPAVVALIGAAPACGADADGDGRVDSLDVDAAIAALFP